MVGHLVKHLNAVRLENASADPLRVILEPYAVEFSLPSGSTCEVKGRSEEDHPEILIEYTKTAIVFWGNLPNAVYEYWQDGVLVD